MSLVSIILVCVLSIFAAAPLSADPPEPPLRLYLFASSTCPECKKIKEDILPDILVAYDELVSFKHIAIDDIEAFSLQLLYEKEYEVKSEESVKFFVGTKCLAGMEEIEKDLARIIDEELIKGSHTLSPEEVLARNSKEKPITLVSERFKDFKPGLVALAGLTDGINPCAFATLVFFVSVLASLKKSKRDILLVGLLFSSSVFVTYTLLGFGALQVIRKYSFHLGVSTYLTVAIAVLALMLSAWSFIDFIRYRRTGDAKSISLKLPYTVRRIVNRMISTGMKRGHIAAWAVVLGVAVSVLESLCTGQIYLPTIMYVIRSRDMVAHAFFYLVLYNLMFIVPLLVVFGLAYGGVSSKTISGFFTRNVGAAKILMSVLFFLLGLGLILTIL